MLWSEEGKKSKAQADLEMQSMLDITETEVRKGAWEELFISPYVLCK